MTTSKKGKRKITVPKYAAPIARAIALKIKAARRIRGLAVDEVAAQLGVKIGQYVYLEAARFIPGPQLANRLYNWLLDPSYRCTAPLSERHYGFRKLGEWKQVKLSMPVSEYHALRKVGVQMGMSMAQFAYFAMRLLASDKRMHPTVEAAAREMHWTRAVQAINEAPELRDILEMDLDRINTVVEGPSHDTIEVPMVQRILSLPTETFSLSDLEADIETED